MLSQNFMMKKQKMIMINLESLIKMLSYYMVFQGREKQARLIQ